MNDINNLFFELIRVAIGNLVCLSRTPSSDEWGELYAMAKKQSLVGICFAGVQRLQGQKQSPPEMLYLQWMGMAAKILQRNELLNRMGKELISQFQDAGLDACVLKGQSLAPYYGDLAALRQSGDIDVWVRNKGIEELDEYVKGLGVAPKTTAAHVSYEDKDGVEVELHAVPAFMRNFRTNRKLVQWLKEFNGSTAEFNLVFLMVHMYHHVLFEGLGLRQVMDYYFVLKNTKGHEYTTNNSLFFSHLGILHFATGIMWVMKTVFALENECLICKADESVGRLLLEEIMQGGNFGQHDEKIKDLHGETAISRSLCRLKRNMKFFALGPLEILSSPLWSVWHFFWRKKRCYK